MMSDETSRLALAERLQRRRTRIMTMQAFVFLIWQFMFLSSLHDFQATHRLVDQVKISAFVVWAALMLLLIATGGQWWTGRKVRDLMNDEVTRDHFRSSHVWGFWTVMLACFAVYVIQLFTPLETMVTLHILLSSGILAAMLRFVWLERTSDAH
jgi:hypothetical protein